MQKISVPTARPHLPTNAFAAGFPHLDPDRWGGDEDFQILTQGRRGNSFEAARSLEGADRAFKVAVSRADEGCLAQCHGFDWIGAVEQSETSADNGHICEGISGPEFANRVQQKPAGCRV